MLCVGALNPELARPAKPFFPRLEAVTLDDLEIFVIQRGKQRIRQLLGLGKRHRFGGHEHVQQHSTRRVRVGFGCHGGEIVPVLRIPVKSPCDLAIGAMA